MCIRDRYRSLHGLTRTLINNMVVGVTDGFKKELEVNGVGYRVQMTGNDLVTVSYTHLDVFKRQGLKKYTFQVAKNANKIEIAKAVEELFDVEVAKVNTINVRGKFRRQGRHEGYTPSWKKAIVTLTEKSKTIEFFEDMM